MGGPRRRAERGATPGAPPPNRRFAEHTLPTYATYASLRTLCVRCARSGPQIDGFSSQRFAPSRAAKPLQRGQVPYPFSWSPLS